MSEKTYDGIVVNTEKKLSIFRKVGFAVGTLADSIPANLFNIFFLVFAVNFAGLNPAFAGIISSIAILWDGITDPIIGYLSDRSKARGKGGRRNFMIRAIVPLGISILLLYRIIEGTPQMVNAYYVGMALLFWTMYTLFNIPYSALGAEITPNYDDRASLRFIAHIFTILGLLIASSLTMVLVGNALEQGASPSQAWSKVAIIYTAIIVCAGLISWAATKGLVAEEINHSYEAPDNPFVEFLDVLKLKSVRIVGLSLLLYAIGFTTSLSSIPFLIEHVLKFDGHMLGTYFALNAALGLLSIPIVNLIVKKFGKRQSFTLLILIAAGLQFACLGANITTFVGITIYGVFQGFGNNTFFPLTYALTYDCCDIDLYVNNKRREGVILSVTGLFQKVGYALGTTVVGLSLAYFGYNAELEIQSAQTLRGMEITLYLIAPLFFTASALLMSRFKITKERYCAMKDAMKAKNNNQSYSEDGFKELL